MKTVWSVLVLKAEHAVRDAQASQASLNQRLERALLQSEKIDVLLADYAAQLSAVQQRDHSSSEVSNYSHFIIQLQTLKSRAQREVRQLEIELQLGRQILAAADRELLKAEQLCARAEEKQARERTSREAREFDAQAIQQHNFRTRAL